MKLIISLVVCVFCVQLVNGRTDRIHYVDQTSKGFPFTHYLFRGTMPIEKHQYQYDELKKEIIKIAMEEAKIQLTAVDFKVWDISLVQVSGDEDANHVQDAMNFYKQNPDKGTLIYWETNGNNENYTAMSSHYSKDFLSYLAKNLADWQGDRLPIRTQQLYDFLHTPAPRTRIYYVHCVHGMDRTGETIGSYYMRYMNLTYQQTLDRDYKVASRAITVGNQNALQWYCYYLYYGQKQMSVGDCSLQHP
eukprot:TRINITY_DN10683_c0_g1_i1.p1 TRINITY_DN10683_c0_g1~~TRINITY_DN10683_c0_g1_i1.p1  ORF type:complete len:248 (+),score=48.13 TRINITY_DN10683_c0_g1_i1:117-860(+)